MDSRARASKIASSTRLESSSLDRVWIESAQRQEDLSLFSLRLCLDHCKDQIVLIYSSSHTHKSFKFIGFGFSVSPDFGFHVKNIDILFTCILDFIHIQYTSKLFQYHIFVFIQALEKKDFQFKIQVLKNTVFLRLNILYHKNSSNSL